MSGKVPLQSKCDPSETDPHVPDTQDRDQSRRKHAVNQYKEGWKQMIDNGVKSRITICVN